MIRQADRPIFIVGFARTGSTLLRGILHTHPALFAVLAEVHYVQEFAGKYGRRISNAREAAQTLIGHPKFLSQVVDPLLVREAFSSDEPVDLISFFKLFFGLVQQAHPGQRLVLKYPAMISELDLVLDIFPDVTIINTIRDPRAAIYSHRRRWPRRRIWWHTVCWNRAVQTAREWRARHCDVTFVDVCYEELVLDPEKVLRQLCAGIGIPFDEKMLQIDQTHPDHTKRDGENIRMRTFDKSRLDTWRKGLRPHEIRLIERRCGAEMAKCGYRPSEETAAPDLQHYLYSLKELALYLYFSLGVTVKSWLRRMGFVKLRRVGDGVRYS